MPGAPFGNSVFDQVLVSVPFAQLVNILQFALLVNARTVRTHNSRGVTDPRSDHCRRKADACPPLDCCVRH